MSRKPITENIKRRLYAESMGKCMNPDCETDLFLNDGDIIEKAHIVPYCDTADNSFENLILLCPNCHTNFDKNDAFNASEVKSWKEKRQKQFSIVFTEQFDTFEELEKVVKPILEENRKIFENYYVKENPKLWEKFEEVVLVNNNKLKLLLSKNKGLIQKHHEKEYSNLEVVDQFLLHVDEFKATRGDEEKIRSVLFPDNINSLFGLEPVNSTMLSSTEALECLIEKLQRNNNLVEVVIGIPDPHIVYKNEEQDEVVLFLNDIPRVRQQYFINNCFRATNIRLESLNFALTYLTKNNVRFSINDYTKLSQILVNGKPIEFIYEYCLSKEKLISLSPTVGLVIVNLHNWNGESCISKEAYEQAEAMNVKLLTMNAFYKYVHRI